MDVRKLLVQLRANPSDRKVSRDLGLARNTVRRYRSWAQRHDLLGQAIPPLDQVQLLLDATLPKLCPPQNASSVEPYRDLVVQLRKEKVEKQAIWARLRERGFTGSYSSVWRFVHSIEPRVPEAVVRVETAPGEEAQVDFGAAGRMLDPVSGTFRKAWAFVLTLSWSRHQYVEFVFDQKVETWLSLHVHAFAYLGAVPRRITCDNLKAAILRAAWDDPLVNLAYQELAEHYGFLIAPCRPCTPQHKGKVESGVHFVARNFLAGREPAELAKNNREALLWCQHVGQRVHGTTQEQPLRRFHETERARLLSLPPGAYDLWVTKKVKLHRVECTPSTRQRFKQAWQVQCPDCQGVKNHARTYP